MLHRVEFSRVDDLVRVEFSDKTWSSRIRSSYKVAISPRNKLQWGERELNAERRV